MVPNIQKMVSDHGIDITMSVPVIAEDMQPVLAVYSAPDMKTFGKGTYEVGMTHEFPAMLVEASKLGTLDRAFCMVNFH